MKDPEKRRRVMRRSLQLGHCICDPKRPCPCDILREQDVCPCAGERVEEPAGPVRLTQLVERPGCASKIDAALLRQVLADLPFPADPRVLVGAPAGDDAGVFRLDDQTALVQTVDVFSPAVDDPYQFGRIAAANSLSDVYAMGGRPLVALSIIGFPTQTLPADALRQILLGGVATMTEAGVPVVGGHSIQDRELKAGFAVTGLVHPQRIVTNAGARPGDRLILTKPLGTGVLAFAAQIGRDPPGSLATAAESMARLNRRAAELMIEAGAHACTDVTGFGLAGHLTAMAAASGVDAEITLDDLPLLPGVLECLAQEILPGAVERNREACGDALVVQGQPAPPPAMVDLCFDPQTSGGLLIALPEPAADALLARLHEEGIPAAAIVGRIVGPGPGRLYVRYEGRRTLDPAHLQHQLHQETSAMSCCSEDGAGAAHAVAAPTGADPAETRQAPQKFQEFLKTANAPGALDAGTKQAIAIALSVLAKCEPCLKTHLQKARDMGFSQEAIDEAAWMAIAFGGSPTMMFYKTAAAQKAK
jgi:selenide,water dikinase